MADELLQDLDEGVLVLTLNRPERHNAWTNDLEDEFFDALTAAAADPDVRVIVMTGSGTSFCPGMDMQVLSDSVEGRTGLTTARARGEHTFVRKIPKPVIAAVNGAAAGIGFVQAVACDLRFASTTAKFTSAFARRGLPAENSLSWMLQRLVGSGTAMDLLLSARVVLAEEAREIGLVDRLYEPDQLLPETLAYAKDLAANCSPKSMATIKAQVHDDWERTADQSRNHAILMLREHLRSPDFIEGVRSYTEKRAPEFDGVSHEVHPRRDGLR